MDLYILANLLRTRSTSHSAYNGAQDTPTREMGSQAAGRGADDAGAT